MSEREYACEICGLEKHNAHNWFLVSNSGGRDRVNVLRWDEARAAQRGMHAVCSSEHARELVARWVLSGTLCCGARGSRWRVESPAPPADGSCCTREAAPPTRCGDPAEVDLKNLEDAAPETLLAILDAVETVLQGRLQQLDKEEAQEEVLTYDA